MQSNEIHRQKTPQPRGNVSAPSEAGGVQRLGQDDATAGEGGGRGVETDGVTKTNGAPGHVYDNVGGPGLGVPPGGSADKRSDK